MKIWKQTKYVNIIASTDGEIYNTKTKRYLGKNAGTNEYCKVGVRDSSGIVRTIEVHRIIAETFIPKPNNDPTLVVNHIGKIKTDNRVCNLEWITPSQNVTGTHGGKQEPKLTKVQRDEVIQLARGGMSMMKITVYMNAKYSRNTSRQTYTRVVKKG